MGPCGIDCIHPEPVLMSIFFAWHWVLHVSKSFFSTVTFWQQLLLTATVGTWGGLVKLLLSVGSGETSQLSPAWLGPRLPGAAVSSIVSCGLTPEQWPLGRWHPHCARSCTSCAWPALGTRGWSCEVTCLCLQGWKTEVGRGCFGQGWPSLPWGEGSCGVSWGAAEASC